MNAFFLLVGSLLSIAVSCWGGEAELQPILQRIPTLRITSKNDLRETEENVPGSPAEDTEGWFAVDDDGRETDKPDVDRDKKNQHELQNTIVAQGYVPLPSIDDEQEKKVVHTTLNIIVKVDAWSKEDERNRQLFWRMSNQTSTLVNSSDGFDLEGYNKLHHQIRLFIKDNPRLLAKKDSLKWEWDGASRVDDLTPMEVMARMVVRTRSMSCAPAYDATLSTMIEIDKDNGRRIEALRILIRGRYPKPVKEFLNKGTEIENAPQLIVDLMNSCCAEKPPKSPSRWKSFFSADKHQYSRILQGSTKKNLRIRDDLPIRQQVNAFAIARLLVKKGADLSRLRPDFPPVTHARNCTSCAYLRNCYLDKTERESVL